VQKLLHRSHLVSWQQTKVFGTGRLSLGLYHEVKELIFCLLTERVHENFQFEHANDRITRAARQWEPRDSGLRVHIIPVGQFIGRSCENHLRQIHCDGRDHRRIRVSDGLYADESCCLTSMPTVQIRPVRSNHPPLPGARVLLLQFPVRRRCLWYIPGNSSIGKLRKDSSSACRRLRNCALSLEFRFVANTFRARLRPASWHQPFLLLSDQAHQRRTYFNPPATPSISKNSASQACSSSAKACAESVCHRFHRVQCFRVDLFESSYQGYTQVLLQVLPTVRSVRVPVGGPGRRLPLSNPH
jgi:hypothetical protein